MKTKIWTVTILSCGHRGRARRGRQGAEVKNSIYLGVEILWDVPLRNRSLYLEQLKAVIGRLS